MIVEEPKKEQGISIPEPDALPEFPQELTPLSRLFDDISFLPTVSTAPSEEPKHPLEKLQIYVNGGTLRLYVYDTANKTWRYASLT